MIKKLLIITCKKLIIKILQFKPYGSNNYFWLSVNLIIFGH